MTRRFSYLVLGMGLALALSMGFGLQGGVTAALPGSARVVVVAPGTCGLPGPWTVVSPIPTAVFGAMTASDGTYVYAAGGYSFQAPGATHQFARYDRAANSWTTLAQIPAAVYDGAAAYANGKIYVFGGTDGSTVLTSTYLYDIATNTWSAGTALPSPREQMGVGYANGKIYIAGGSDSQDINPQNTLYAYDVAGASWTTQAPLPQAVAGPGSGMINGHLYIAGGRDASSPNRTTVYNYDTGANSWTTAAPLLTGVNAPGSAVVDGEFIVFGGGNPFSRGQVPATTNATQVYDPVSNAWVAGPTLNTARSFVGGASVDNYLVAVGGYNGATSLSSVEVSFMPCGSPTPVSTSTNTVIATNTSTFTPTGTRTATSTSSSTVTSTRTPTTTGTVTPPGTSTTTPTQTSTGVVTETSTSTPTTTTTGIVTGTSTSTPTGTLVATGTTTSTSTLTPTGTGTPATPTATGTPCTISFTDVLPSDYFYEDVRCDFCLGAVSGYADGTFRPFNSTTRGQMTKIIVLALRIPISTPTGTPTFNDVLPGSAFYDYVETAAANDIVSGYSDGTFRPNASVTRGQLSKIDAVAANHRLGWDIINPTTPTFSDVPRDSAFYEYIETVSCHGVVSGYSDGTFRPGNNAIRAQIAKIICRTSQNPPPCE